MEVKELKRPQYLKAVIKTSGIESPVEWIDLESGRCKTKAGYEFDLDNFEFVDLRDYDAMRGEYAGRAMQAMIDGMMKNENTLMGMRCRAATNGQALSVQVAADAVAYADALIGELKRPRDWKETFGLKKEE